MTVEAVIPVLLMTAADDPNFCQQTFMKTSNQKLDFVRRKYTYWHNDRVVCGLNPILVSKDKDACSLRLITDELVVSEVQVPQFGP